CNERARGATPRARSLFRSLVHGCPLLALFPLGRYHGAMTRLTSLALLLTLSAVPASAQTPPPVGPAPTPITSLVAQVTALFPKVEGDVLKVDGGAVTLSIGRRDGIVAGVVGMGDPLGVALAQQGVKPEEGLEGKGLQQVAERFKAENRLVLHFKRVDTKPYMDVRLYEMPRTEAALTTAFFVPPSIRPTTQ